MKYYNGDKTCTNKHIYAGKERVCTVVDNEPAYIHRDHLNSGGVVSTNGGGVGDRVAFAPYGEVLYQQNTNASAGSATGIDEKFTGQLLDPETGLYYFNARYYDPKVGIFISADSIVPDSLDSQALNRYMYVRGNPIAYTDPTGHFFFSAIIPGVGTVLDSACYGALAGGAFGGASYMLSAAINGDKLDGDDFWNSVGWGALNGAINFGLNSGLNQLGFQSALGGGMSLTPSITVGPKGMSIGASFSYTTYFGSDWLRAGFHTGVSLDIGWNGATSVSGKIGGDINIGGSTPDGRFYGAIGYGINGYFSLNGVPGNVTGSISAFQAYEKKANGVEIHKFGIRHENDLFLPGDNDRYRTAAGSLTVYDYSVGFSLITGDLASAKLKDPGDFYKYQQGVIYFGYRNLRVGTDSQRTRRNLQNGVHGFTGAPLWMGITDGNYYSWAIGGDPYWYY